MSLAGEFAAITVAQVPTASNAFDRNQTSIARLANGGAVVGWRSGGTLSARIVAADGTPQRQLDIPATRPLDMKLVGLTGGGWAAVWLEETQRAMSQTGNSYTLRFRIYEANGDLRRDTVEATGAGVLYWSLTAPSVVATPDGGFAVAWSGRPYIVAPYWAYLQRYDANGGASGAQFQSPPSEYSSKVASLPDGSLVLASTTGESGGVLTLRHFDAATGLATPPVPVAGTETSAPSYLRYEITGLPDGTIALAWAKTGFNEPAASATSQALTALGVPLSPLVPITTTEPQIDTFSIVAHGNGYAVLPQAFIGFNRGSFARLGEVQVGPGGVASAYQLLMTASISSVSPTTGATTGPAVPGFAVTANGTDHVMAAYERGISGGAEVVLEGR